MTRTVRSAGRTDRRPRPSRSWPRLTSVCRSAKASAGVCRSAKASAERLFSMIQRGFAIGQPRLVDDPGHVSGRFPPSLSECANGSAKRSTVVNAIVFAATIMPFRPMVSPAHAVACQLCAGTPGTKVAATTYAVGTFQLIVAGYPVDALPTAPMRIGCTFSGSRLNRGASVRFFAGPPRTSVHRRYTKSRRPAQGSAA